MQTSHPQTPLYEVCIGRLQNGTVKFNVNVFMEHNPAMKIPYDYLKIVPKAHVRKNYYYKTILRRINHAKLYYNILN